MELAMITPIYNGESRLKVSNYRSVSLLLILSNVFEKTAQNRLVEFLNKHKIIFEKQYGFQKNSSATLVILDLYKRVTKALDNNEFAGSVFLYFAKVFDIIHHETPTKKLENYGIRKIANKWFSSYLQNRYQVVKISNNLS